MLAASKISIKAFKRINTINYNEPTIQHLMALYEQMVAKQDFSSTYLMKDWIAPNIQLEDYWQTLKKCMPL